MRQTKCTVGHPMCEIHIGLEVCERRTWWSNRDRWEPMCAVYGTSQLTGRRRQEKDKHTSVLMCAKRVCTSGYRCGTFHCVVRGHGSILAEIILDGRGKYVVS